jgi:putative heme iron utilization protein
MSNIATTYLDRSTNPHKLSADSPAADLPMPLDPLVEVPEPRRRTAAEEARTILAGANVGTLASLTNDGNPWASVVTYAVIGDGTPVLCLSTLAQHGRNLKNDPRASLAVAAPVADGQDPSDAGRVTLAGKVEEPSGDELDEARAAYHAAVPSGEMFTDFGDFTFWMLRVERVRWVGGFGRMASATPDAYHAAEPDPVAGRAGYAVSHLNTDHRDHLLAMARAFSGHTDATAALCLRADRYGLDLALETPRGQTPARVAFAEPITEPDGLRAATVELSKRAQQAAVNA